MWKPKPGLSTSKRLESQRQVVVQRNHQLPKRRAVNPESPKFLGMAALCSLGQARQHALDVLAEAKQELRRERAEEAQFNEELWGNQTEDET